MKITLPGEWPGTISEDRRGRRRIYLGKKHPAANSGGWQWLPRFIVWRETGVVLRDDEHVHHKNGDVRDDRFENYEVVVAEYHGRTHGSATLLARDPATGCFLPSGSTYPIPRFGPVLGRAATEI